jgi:heme exporter protein A
MRILLGLSASYEGSLYWREQDMARSLFDFRSELLYIGHDVGVKSNLTPEENLAWACPNVTKQDIYVALKRVGLMGYEDLLTHGLSAGQQRRVALARLFLSSKDLENKPLWILDEPFTAIDKDGVADLERVIVDHAQQGGLVILTTHHDLSVPVKTIMLGQTQKATL